MGADKEKVTVTLDLTDVSPPVRHWMERVMRSKGIEDILPLIQRELLDCRRRGEDGYAADLTKAHIALFSSAKGMMKVGKGMSND